MQSVVFLQRLASCKMSVRHLCYMTNIYLRRNHVHNFAINLYQPELSSCKKKVFFQC